MFGRSSKNVDRFVIPILTKEIYEKSELSKVIPFNKTMYAIEDSRELQLMITTNLVENGTINQKKLKNLKGFVFASVDEEYLDWMNENEILMSPASISENIAEYVKQLAQNDNADEIFERLWKKNRTDRYQMRMLVFKLKNKDNSKKHSIKKINTSFIKDIFEKDMHRCWISPNFVPADVIGKYRSQIMSVGVEAFKGNSIRLGIINNEIVETENELAVLPYVEEVGPTSCFLELTCENFLYEVVPDSLLNRIAAAGETETTEIQPAIGYSVLATEHIGEITISQK